MGTVAAESRKGRGAAAPPTGASDGAGERRNFAPSLVDIFFIMLALVVPLRWHHQLLNADGDLAIHLRMGHDILREHAIPFVDRFSYTMAGQTLIPTSWLSEVLDALVENAGGLAGIVLFTGVVLAVTYALVALFLRRRNVDGRLAVVACLFSVLLGAIHWLPRPHLFTILGSVVLLHLLERGDDQSVWPYAVLFAVWSNLHGGWLYGVIVLAVYAAGEAVEALAARRGVRDALGGDDGSGTGGSDAGGSTDDVAFQRDWRRRAVRHGVALLVACAASLLNPGGVLLLKQIGGSLGSSHMVDTTVEYRSPDFHLMGPRFFLVLLLLALLLLARDRRRMPFPWLAVVLVNLAFALFSVRNIPLFGVTALPLLTVHAAGVLRRRRAGYVFGDGFADIDRRARVGVWSIPVLAVVVALGLNHGRVVGVPVLPDAFHPAHFPIEAVDRAKAAGLQGHLFTEFIWAGYVIYAWPEQKVFASSQKYTDPVSRDYLDVFYLSPGWRDVLDRWDVKLLLLPRETPLSNEVRHDPGWAVWYCDQTAVLLVRAGGAYAPSRPVVCPKYDPEKRHRD